MTMGSITDFDGEEIVRDDGPVWLYLHRELTTSIPLAAEAMRYITRIAPAPWPEATIVGTPESLEQIDWEQEFGASDPAVPTPAVVLVPEEVAKAATNLRGGRLFLWLDKLFDTPGPIVKFTALSLAPSAEFFLSRKQGRGKRNTKYDGLQEKMLGSFVTAQKRKLYALYALEIPLLLLLNPRAIRTFLVAMRELPRAAHDSKE